LAAVKLHIPVAHVEAGLRSFNRDMPEEHNRVLTDHCSELLFCPTQTAVIHLNNEGITHGVYLVGDTMYDAVLAFYEIACQRSTILGELGLDSKQYFLATLHRPYNTDILENLQNILLAFGAVDRPVVFPAHPRTVMKMNEQNIDLKTTAPNVQLIDPVGYLDMLMLERHAAIIMTDSGGIQKEAYFFEVPCITMRPETEWTETVENGWNILTGADYEKIVEAAMDSTWFRKDGVYIFGDGKAADKIVGLIGERILDRFL